MEAVIHTDPRFRNKVFDASSISNYARSYAAALADAIGSVDQQALSEAASLIEAVAAAGGRVYAIGNGGSAAIADHLCCDWTKGTQAKGARTIACTSLSANVALYSAIANDYGFESVFSTQVDFFGQDGDLLVAISSSGNSANIIRAVTRAKALGIKTIGLAGFEGGGLKNAADIALHVDAQNYGVVEDAHQALMHILAQFIALGRDKKA